MRHLLFFFLFFVIFVSLVVYSYALALLFYSAGGVADYELAAEGDVSRGSVGAINSIKHGVIGGVANGGERLAYRSEPHP